MGDRETEIVTREMIESRRSPRGGFTAKDLAWLGVAWPPEKGWKWRILGKPRRPVEAPKRGYRRAAAVPEHLEAPVRRLFELAMDEAKRRGWSPRRTEPKVVRGLAERFSVRKCAIRRVVGTHRRKGHPSNTPWTSS